MKLIVLVPFLIVIFSLNACSDSPGTGTRGTSKPDLVITGAEISLGETCQAGNVIVLVKAVIKNQGEATSLARSDVGLVGTSEVTTNWGNGVGLPALAPGQSTEVEIPVYYLIADPSFMQGNHDFEVFVNSGGWIDESNTSNNKFFPNLNINVPANFCKFPVQGRSWGDPHIITFDKLKYEFQTVGEFWLVKTPEEDFAVQVCQQPWRGSQRVSVNTSVAALPYNTSVAALLSEHRVNVYLNVKESPIRVDGGELNIEDGGSVEVSEGNIISRKGNDYTLISASGDRVVIELRGSYLNVSVHTTRFEGVTGLLGNANSNTTDDMALSNGEVLSQPMSLATRYRDFANSWRITSGSLFIKDNFECPSNEDFPKGKDVILDELDSEARQKAQLACKDIQNNTLLEACIIDVALTGDTSFAEASANAPVPNTVLELAKPDCELKHHWQGEDNASDSVGTGHGSLINGADFGPGVFPNSRAFELDGVDDYIKVLNSNVYDFGTTSFSIDLWMQTSFSNISQGIFYKGNGPFNASGEGIELRTATNPNQQYHIAEFSRTDGTPFPAWIPVGERLQSRTPRVNYRSMTAGQWHYISITYDVVSKLGRMYVDGVLTDESQFEIGSDYRDPAYTSLGPSGLFQDTFDLFMGKGAGTHFNGLLDEIKVHDCALSEQDVITNYENDLALIGF